MADEKPLDVRISIPERMRDVDIFQLRRAPVKVPALLGSTSTPESIKDLLEQIKQVIETREGTRGSWVERSVTWRDLIGTGIAKVNVDGVIYDPGTGIGGGGGGIIPPNPDTPIYTPPPAPTGVNALGAMTMVIVEWDAPNYSYHGYAEIWRSETNVLGNATLIGTATGSLFADELGPDVSRYYWVRFVNKYDNAIKGPYNATDGTLATTGADVPYLLEQLEGQITQTQLDATLSAEIDQIDVLAMEVSSLTAGVSGAFDPFKTYYFDTTAEGWIADTDATVSHSNGHLIVNSTGTTPSVKLTSDLSPGVTGANYPVVKARIKRVSGSTWSGKLQWKTSGHAFSGSYQKVIADPSLSAGDYATIEWDMSADADYTGANPVLNLRLELGAASDDDFDIDWIAVGRNAPGASVAMVGEETAARVAADEAEITARELLAVKVIGTADPDDIDGIADLASGLIYEEKSVRAADDVALAQDIETLSTTVDGNTASIEVNATSINGLEAQYTVKIDVNGYVSGYGLASYAPVGDPGGQVSIFGIRADTFYIASPTGPGITPTMPFVVKTTDWVSDGNISNPPGIYMTSAFIADGQITNAKIGQLAVDNAKIANLDAVKITAGTIAADRLDANDITAKVLSVNVAKLTTGIVGGNIYSQSYSSGSSGWAMNQAGNVEFNNGTFRGNVYASNGVFSGTVYASSGSFTGAVYATSGSFTGSINAGGVFTGVLSAAVGTFGGSVTGTAVIGTAQIADANVTTLKLANQSVVIPVSAENPGVYGGNGNWQTIISASISLPDAYTKMFITFSCAMKTLGLDPASSPIGWAFRILNTEGTAIYYVGPSVYGGDKVLQGAMTFARHWAEYGPATRSFTVQFFGDSGNIIAQYPYFHINATRNS